MIGERLYNEVIDQIDIYNNQIKELQDNLKHLESFQDDWKVSLREKFELLDNDEIIALPQWFVLRFKRDGENMVAMQQTTGEISQFAESILKMDD